MRFKRRMASAEEIIQKLGLKPHPEGGHYRETFRDERGQGRAASTAVYYLLKAGEVSRWHRVDAAEVWHWYAGAALELTLAPAGGKRSSHILGNDLKAGQLPQAIVPANVWQTAKSLGKWTLIGCTVAPGFVFERFELAPEGWEP
jgi:uncharacterized protein